MNCRPLPMAIRTPMKLHAFLFGRLNRVYAVPGSNTSEQSWNGPVGFIVE